MRSNRALIIALLGLVVLAKGCTPLSIGTVPAPIPVPPWVAERMEEKYDKRYQTRTPIMPPIRPGMNPVLCVDPPTDGEVIRALPKVARGVPFVYEEFRDDFTVVVELIVDKIDPCTFVPLIGPAQLHHCHYKCTVYYKERIMSGYPFPFQTERDRVEIIYIDRDHYHLCVGNDKQMQESVSRATGGP